jgi:hypothetical protein
MFFTKKEPIKKIKPRRYFFFEASLIQLGIDKHAQYMAASPFPHAVFDNFLPPDVANKIYEEFPPADFKRYRKMTGMGHEKKLAKLEYTHFEGVSPFCRQILAEFNGMVFLQFLEKLTGIESLIEDASFKGGAFHQVLRGGSLGIHADFNRDKRRLLDRRINVLFYVNKDWQEEYGGNLELWDEKMKNRVVNVSPILNRCVIFSTTRTSYHGHPDPLACPEGMSRKSLAFYYYTNPDPNIKPEEPYSTLWQDRPQDRNESL